MAYFIVPVLKSDSTTRLCLDRHRSNTVIIHERYVIPKLEDILTELHNVTVFSKLDLREGYHQILLNPDSRHTTAFATHNGVFQYKQLIYGINLAFELFQPQIEQVISGCNGVKNISDDMTIGKKISKNTTRIYESFSSDWKNIGSNLTLKNASSAQSKTYCRSHLIIKWYYPR